VASGYLASRGTFQSGGPLVESLLPEVGAEAHLAVAAVVRIGFRRGKRESLPFSTLRRFTSGREVLDPSLLCGSAFGVEGRESRRSVAFWGAVGLNEMQEAEDLLVAKGEGREAVVVEKDIEELDGAADMKQKRLPVLGGRTRCGTLWVRVLVESGRGFQASDQSVGCRPCPRVGVFKRGGPPVAAPEARSRLISRKRSCSEVEGVAGARPKIDLLFRVGRRE